MKHPWYLVLSCFIPAHALFAFAHHHICLGFSPSTEIPDFGDPLCVLISFATGLRRTKGSSEFHLQASLLHAGDPNLSP